MNPSRAALLSTRRRIWRIRNSLARLIAPKGLASQPRDLPPVEKVKTATSEGAANSRSATARGEAFELWEKGELDSAVDHLRRALRTTPQDSLLWMSLGDRLQNSKQYHSAYLAYTNAVELDPGNFGATEQFVAMALGKREFERIKAVLAPLSGAITGRPHRFIESLNYSIAYDLRDAIEVVAEESAGLPAAIARFHLKNDDSLLQDLDQNQHTLALVVHELATGNWCCGKKLVRELVSDSVPLTSLRLAIRRAKASENEESADALLEEYLRVRPDDPWANKFRTLSSPGTDFSLLKREYPIIANTSARNIRDIARNRVAYTVYNSLPYHSAGYATRTQGLLSALRRQGWDISATTRLEYPIDMPGYEELNTVPAEEWIDGVPYHRLVSVDSKVPRRPLEKYVKQYCDNLKKYLSDQKVTIVHAASNHLNGLASISAAAEMGMPSIYEVRGLWEVTRASRDPIWGQGPEYRLAVKLETEVAKKATEVIALTSGLKSELVKRGVDEKKITVVPNGVDVSRFHPVPRAQSLAQALEVGGRTVIGYVGSIVDYEGLELLVEAVAELAAERNDFVLLIVGDGKNLKSLKQFAADLSVKNWVRFVGQVPHEDVRDYFSLIDIAPFPRLPLPVCELVSPLKPFEAMAMGKSVVCSDVEALSEIVQDNVTGLLHTKGDVASLTSALRRLLNDPELRAAHADAARDWVRNQRTWTDSADGVGTIYRRLGGVPSETTDGSHKI